RNQRWERLAHVLAGICDCLRLKPAHLTPSTRGKGLHMLTKTWAAGAAFGLLVLSSGMASGQQAGPTMDQLRRQQEVARRVPVTIALWDQLPAPDSVPAVILRRGTAAPRDVIALRRRATPGQLAAAVMRLMVIRDRMGDTAHADVLFRLPNAHGMPKGKGRREELQAGRTLARLRAAPAQVVSGVGRVPALEVYLPSRAMREEARRRRAGTPR
ncbi:MAG TPA: hypothetical protein VF705_04055, partial [Longimicrobium sp.]